MKSIYPLLLQRTTNDSDYAAIYVELRIANHNSKTTPFSKTPKLYRW
jgi:hypothetical protein